MRRPGPAEGGGGASGEGGDAAEAVSAHLKVVGSAAERRIRAADDTAELRLAESEVMGKGSAIAGISTALGRLAPEARRLLGQELNQTRARLATLARERRAELERAERQEQLDRDRLDLTEVLPGRMQGHLHLVAQTRASLEDTFIGMGFVVAEGPEVETDWYNFEALNMPRAHPARANQDNFYLRMGEPESVLLRTHTSPVQIRVMQAQPPPIYAVMPGQAHRRDTPDARHLPSFNQIEGLVVDREISFAHLAGTIDAFTGAYFGPAIHSRLRPASFPFTEPSAEFEITCTICGGSGCRTCSGSGWVELGGAGMVDPAVFGAVGIDPEIWSGFAFGFGIDRLAQMRHGLSDMRVLLDNDVRLLAQF